MKNIKHIVSIAALTLMSGAVMAQTNASPWYLGGSVGKSGLKLKTENLNANLTGVQDTSDTGFKIYGGYQFAPNWAVEVQYASLGKYSYTKGTASGQIKTDGFSVAAVGSYPVTSDIKVFGKLGLAAQKFKLTAKDTATGDSGWAKANETTPLIGAGVDYAFSKQLSLRAEYEYFGVPTLARSGNQKVKLRTDLFSVGLRYQF
jgi:OOP family OmpA-OmpF porin